MNWISWGSQCLSLRLHLYQKHYLLPWPLIFNIFFKGRKQKASCNAWHRVPCILLIIIFLASPWKHVSLEVLWSSSHTQSVVVEGFPLVSLTAQTDAGLCLNMVPVLGPTVHDSWAWSLCCLLRLKTSLLYVVNNQNCNWIIYGFKVFRSRLSFFLVVGLSSGYCAD